MAHGVAMEMNAAERYVLGELEPEQRDAYEEHFFSCSECASEVLAASRLAEGIHLQGSLPQPELRVAPPRLPWWSFLWSPALGYAAAAVLLAVLSYQNFVMLPDMRREVAVARRPLALISFNLTALGSRAVEEQVIQPPTDKPFALLVSIPPEPQAYAYEVKLVTAGGVERLGVPVTAEQARDTVQILVPPNALSSGRYRLVTVGVSEAGQRTPVAGYDFIVQ